MRYFREDKPSINTSLELSKLGLEMPVRIVTDSTCDIPADIAEQHGITIIPVYVIIGDESYLDGVDITREAFYANLPDYRKIPTTAAPAPGVFTEVYDRLAEEGVRQIISIHVSSTLSGLMNAARLGAEATNKVEVTVVDSLQVTMGLGLQVLVAAKAAAEGLSASAIVALLTDLVKRTYVIGFLDTLEYLRRSGRVNWAEFGIGTLLRVKPLLRVHTGQVEIVERIRTKKRALDRFIELVTELGPLENIALLHTHATEDNLRSFREFTQFLGPEGDIPLAVDLTPALGVHLGPGGLGIACIIAGNE